MKFALTNFNIVDRKWNEIVGNNAKKRIFVLYISSYYY